MVAEVVGGAVVDVEGRDSIMVGRFRVGGVGVTVGAVGGPSCGCRVVVDGSTRSEVREMVRKRESVAEREARERLRDRYDAEVRAVAEFFGYASQIDQLNAKIDVLIERQVETVARLAESTDASRAADTVCWSVNKVRDAVAATRRDVGGSSPVAPTSEVAL